MVVALLCTPVQALTVRPARGGGLLWASPVSAGAQFELCWTHTVTRRPVSETYMVEPDRRIRLERMVFDQYGPNLPAAPEGGTTWQFGPEGVTVTGYTERYDRLNLGVGPIAHQLTIGTRTFDLVAEVGADRLITLQVERIPWFRTILLGVYPWRSSNRS